VSLANSQLARISAFSEFDTMPHARRSHPLRPFDRHLDETCKTGRRPISRCGVCPRKASTDFESIEETITEFTCIGSNHRRFVRTADASGTRYPLCNRAQTVNSSSFPPCSGETKVSHPVFPKRRRKPGPLGPSKELIDAIVEMKRRNPNWGCPRIAQQITLAFGIPINKDVVRRILGNHYQPGSDSGGPSWLTFIGHMKDCPC
jgi:hypothetical protein